MCLIRLKSWLRVLVAIFALFLVTFFEHDFAQASMQPCFDQLSHSRKTIQMSAGSFSYLEAGDPANPLVLFLHGFPENAMGWCQQMAELSSHYHTVALDQRSYGASAIFPNVSDSAISHLVMDVIEFISRINPQTKSAHIVAHDWGGSVAYALALASPKTVKSLFVMNAPHPFVFANLMKDPTTKQFVTGDYIRQIITQKITAETLKAENYKSFTDYLYPTELFQDDRVKQLFSDNWNRPGAMAAQLNWYRAIDFSLPMNEATQPKYVIHVPTLLLWGELDDRITTENLVGIDRFFDNGFELVRVPNASHWILHEQPQLVNEKLEEFLKAQH